jgi:hypothetical protein
MRTHGRRRARGGDGARVGGGSAAGRFCGAECTIAQTRTALRVTRVTGSGERTTEYALDGTETTTTTTAAGQSTIASKTRATWNGSSLVITTATGIAGQIASTKAELSLGPKGLLIIRRTSTPLGGGPPVLTTQAYTKKQ